MNRRGLCRWLLAATCIALPAGCGSDPVQTSPDERAVTLRTTACGHASRTTGSGVVVDDGLVLTAAHVVVGATDVLVETPSDVASTVVLIDRSRDLALLAVPGVDAQPPDIVELDAGQDVRIVGAASSGTVDATVERRLTMQVDDVRRATRSQRAGYELDAAISGGDSGAGVFDDEGRLAGIVFAVPTTRDRATFAVGAREIDTVLTSPDRVDHVCDPDRSEVVPVE